MVKLSNEPIQTIVWTKSGLAGYGVKREGGYYAPWVCMDAGKIVEGCMLNETPEKMLDIDFRSYPVTEGCNPNVLVLGAS